MKLKEIRELLKSGRPIQTQVYKGIWKELSEESEIYFNCEKCSYRLKPETKLRQWKPEEFKLGVVYRRKDIPQFKYIPIGCDGMKLHLGKIDEPASSEKLLQSFEWANLSDLSQWYPCGVEVEE